METQYKLDPCGVLIPLNNYLIEDLNTIKKVTTSLQDLKKSNQFSVSNKSTNENSEEEEENLFELIFHTKTQEIISKQQSQQQQNDVFSPKNNIANNLVNQSPIHQNQHNFNVFSSSFVKTKKFKQQQQPQSSKQKQQQQPQGQQPNDDLSQNNNDNNQSSQNSFNKPPLSRISSFNKIQLKKSAQKEDANSVTSNNIEQSPLNQSPHQVVKFADSVVDKSVNNEEVSSSNNSNFNNKSPFSKLSLHAGINSNSNSAILKNLKQYNPIQPSKFQGAGGSNQYRNSQQVEMKTRNDLLKMRNSGILHNLGNEFRKSLPFINPEQNKKNKKISFAIFGEYSEMFNNNNEDELNSSNEECQNNNSNNEVALKKNIQPKSIYRQSLVDIMQKNSARCNLEINAINLNSPKNSLHIDDHENTLNRDDQEFQMEDSIVSEGDEYDEEEDEENRKSIEQYGIKINVVRVDDYDLTSIINENKNILYPKIDNIQLTNSQLIKCNLNYQNCMPLAMRQALAYNDGAIDPLNYHEQGIINSNSKFINNELHFVPNEKESHDQDENLTTSSTQKLDNISLQFGNLKLAEKKNQIATISLSTSSSEYYQTKNDSRLLNSLSVKKGQIIAHQTPINQLRTDVLEQKNQFSLSVQKNVLLIKDDGSKTGTFVKLKNGNPLILNKSQLIKINSHAGFYVKSLINTEGQLDDNFISTSHISVKNSYKDFSQDFFDENGEYDILCVNQLRQSKFESKESSKNNAKVSINTYSSENRKLLRDLITKNKCPAIKLVFVKKISELEMYEEYKTQIILYNINPKSQQFTKKNYIKFGYKEKFINQNLQENPGFQQNKKQTQSQQQIFHLIDQIALPYDLYIGFDVLDKIWFLNSEFKNAKKLFTDKTSKILKFSHFNFVNQQKNKKSNHIKGLNLNNNSSNNVQQLFDNTEFNVKNEEILEYGPWVCISVNFNPQADSLVSTDWLEIGNNSYVNYDQKVYQIKLGKYKQII